MREMEEFGCGEGEREENLIRNRYRDILPYDYSRVVLEPIDPFTGTHDYINANFINGASGRVSYIAAQGPVSESVEDFWRMIVQYSVQLIVMVCNLEEYGKRKCWDYWREGAELSLGVSGVLIEQVGETEDLGQDLLQRFLRIRVPAAAGQAPASRPIERIVRQLHYTKWPDHGAPENADPILHLLSVMRGVQPYDRTPILAHCSAGVGRTGTIIALDYVRALLQQGLLGKTQLDLAQIVLELRRQRPAMVQTPDQYVLLHRCVAALFRQQLGLMADHHYHNLPLATPSSSSPSTSADSASSSDGGSEPQSKENSVEAAANRASLIVGDAKAYTNVGGVVVPDFPHRPDSKPRGPTPDLLRSQSPPPSLSPPKAQSPPPPKAQSPPPPKEASAPPATNGHTDTASS